MSTPSASSLVIASCAALLAGPCSQADDTRPSIDSQTVMLYYRDLTAAATFYGEKLGLKKTRDFGWAKFFRVSPGADVGIVKAGPGAYHQPQRRNAVMLSIITHEVDSWYGRLKPDKSIMFAFKRPLERILAERAVASPEPT